MAEADVTGHRRRRNPLATAGLVLVATAAIFVAVGITQATYPSRLGSVVLTWQGAVALALTFVWGLVDLVIYRRLQRAPFTDKAGAKRAITIHAASVAMTVIILAVDLGLLVMAGLAIKTAIMFGGAILAVWMGLVIVALIIVGLRRHPRGRAGPSQP